MMNGTSLERVVELGARIVEMRKQLEVLEEQIKAEEASLEKLLGGRRKNGVAAALVKAASEERGAPKRRAGSKPKARGAAKAPRAKKAAARKSKVARGGAGGGTIMDAIVELLETRRGEALSVADVAGALNAKPTSIATMLKRLLMKGRVTRPETGRYAAA